MKKDDLKALYIIANAGFSDDIIEIANEAGIKGGTILNARGEGLRHESILGITVDSEKDIILCVTDEQSAENCMSAIAETAGIKTSAHAICFTMPVEKTVGLFISDEA